MCRICVASEVSDEFKIGSFATIGLQFISDNAIELGVMPKRRSFEVIW